MQKRNDTTASLHYLQSSDSTENSKHLAKLNNLLNEKFNINKYSISSINQNEQEMQLLNESLTRRNKSPSKKRETSKELPFDMNKSLQFESKAKEDIYEYVSVGSVNVPSCTHKSKRGVIMIEVFMPVIDIERKRITYPTSNEPIVHLYNVDDHHKLKINRELGEIKKKGKLKKCFHQLKFKDEQRMFPDDNILKSPKRRKERSCGNSSSLVKMKTPQVQTKFDEANYYFNVNTIQYTDKNKRNNLSIFQGQSKQKKEILLFPHKDIRKSANHKHKNNNFGKPHFVQLGCSTNSKHHESRKNSSLEINKDKTQVFFKETGGDKSILVYKYKIMSPSSSSDYLKEYIGDTDISRENKCCSTFTNTRKEIDFKGRDATKNDAIRFLKTTKDHARINIPLKYYRQIKRNAKIIDEKPRKYSRKNAIITRNDIFIKENEFSRKGLENMERKMIDEENNSNEKVTEITVGVINLADELTEDGCNLIQKAKFINTCKETKQKKATSDKQLQGDNEIHSILGRKLLHQIPERTRNNYDERRIIPPINSSKKCSTADDWLLGAEEVNRLNMKTWIM